MCNVTPNKVSKEAKDGSSIHVDFKTSLFEAVKCNIVQVLNKDPNIEKVTTSRVTKAKSNSGDAAVEFMADVVLIKDGVKHEIIMKCFTTKCKIQLQKRGKHVKFNELDGKFVPKYFMENYIVPFAEKILASHSSLDEQFVPHLAAEIERLRGINVKSNTKSKIPENTKCANTRCTQKITKNANTSAQCKKCKTYEHFKCAGTTNAMKEDIKEDTAKFFCSVCLDKNPALGLESFVKDSSTLIEITPDIHIDAIELKEIVDDGYDRSLDLQSKFQCENCDKAFFVYQDIMEHIELNHKNKSSFACQKCSETFISNKSLRNHIQRKHSNLDCEKCDLRCTCESQLKQQLEEHSESEYKCKNCPHIATSSSNLEKHSKSAHVEQCYRCEKCGFASASNTDISNHMQEH